MARQSVMIGVLHDAAKIDWANPVFRGMELKREAFNAAGGIAGYGVEFHYLAGAGAHEGSPDNVVRAWEKLAARPEVIGIMGPGITDNALAVAEAVDRVKVPTINWSGHERTRGEWYFQFQAGSLTDEMTYLARLLAKEGRKRVAVLQCRGPIGDLYYTSLEMELHLLGVQIAGRELTDVHTSDVTPQLRVLMKDKADCLLFLGMSAPTLTFVPAARKLGWKVPVYSNIAMLVVANTPAAIAKNEGVVWPDQYDERNPVLRRLERAYAKRWGGRPPADFRAAFGYDMMTLMTEGLRRAPELTRAGLKTGLEQVRNLPCATGGRNPVMGFSPWDHAAIKGPDLFMFRTVRKGKVVRYEP